MGIQGLLQFIKDASEPISVRKYKGQTVAVDTYCWLHKGAFSCAEKLAKGEPTDQYVMYCMKFVDMLLTFGVKPILVFDGCNLPSKKEVDTARRERRQANLQKGKQLLREGKISAARDCFTRCINVTPAMAREVIKAARTRGVDCVVAPYEADAQLAFLNKAGIAQAIITEDSDLLAFGCKKVILKMDKLGNGLEVDQSNLGRCRALGDVFTEEKFRYMCILSGCDYLASLYGIGLGKACKLLKVASNPDILKVIRKMGQYLKMSVTVSEEYIEGFVKANNTFLYQLVFDPIRRKVVPLNPYPDDIDPASLSYAGHNVGDVKGLQMALGNLDFNTMQKIDDYNPDTAQAARPRSRGWNHSKENRCPPEASIWRKGYTPGGPPPSLPPAPPAPRSPERPSTKGKERVVCAQGLRLPHRELPVKRPREDPGVSEEDILEQYSSSSSGLKKQRREERLPAAGVAASPAEMPAAAARQPRPRNRFATLLQRRNQDDEAEDGQGTHSRFFCSVGSSEGASPEPQGPGAEGSDGPRQPGERLRAGEDSEVEETGGRREGAPSPPSSQSPQPAGRGRGVFSWPGGGGGGSGGDTATPTRASGLSTLQRFQRTKDTFSWSAPCPTGPPPSASPPCRGGDGREDEEETPPDSPPSQDSAYFSQPGRSSPGEEEAPPPSQHRDSAAELNTSQESDCSENTSCAPVPERKPATIRAKVSGLPRVRSGDLGKQGRVQASGPARASGLRRKPAGPGKRAGANNENAPGLQATISSLWKNFGFQKERPKITLGMKGEPLSPVKDNVTPLTPESSTDVYFISESTTHQKTICL